MKTTIQDGSGFKKATRRGIHRVFFSLATAVAISMFSGITKVNTANAAVCMQFRQVTDSQVITYLNNQGYTGVFIYQIMQDGTRKCTSTNHSGYWIYVYLSQPDQASIIGHEDIPF